LLLAEGFDVGALQLAVLGLEGLKVTFEGFNIGHQPLLVGLKVVNVAR
jgi:hypothetical protein